MPADPLAALDALPQEVLPLALGRLLARLMSPQAPEAPDDLLTPAEAATLLRRPVRWVWAHSRELGAQRVSKRKLLLSRRKVLRWLEARRAA